MAFHYINHMAHVFLPTARSLGWHRSGLGGLDPKELDTALAGVPPEERAAGRFALLTALASYRVDGAVVAAYRARYPTDTQLLGAAAWVSYVSAWRVGQWLWEALPASHR